MTSSTETVTDYECENESLNVDNSLPFLDLNLPPLHQVVLQDVQATNHLTEDEDLVTTFFQSWQQLVKEHHLTSGLNQRPHVHCQLQVDGLGGNLHHDLLFGAFECQGEEIYRNLKAVDTIGDCQSLAFTVGGSQHMHKITNL